LIAFVAVGLVGWAPAAPHPKLEAGDACHCVSGRGSGALHGPPILDHQAYGDGGYRAP
jgi:hypothetical protein